MRTIALLSRVAFICNVCFLLTIGIMVSHWVGAQGLQSTVAVLGIFLAFYLNPVINAAVLLVYFRKRAWLAAVPRWLLIANGIFLILQLTYIFYLDGPQAAY